MIIINKKQQKNHKSLAWSLYHHPTYSVLKMSGKHYFQPGKHYLPYSCLCYLSIFKYLQALFSTWKKTACLLYILYNLHRTYKMCNYLFSVNKNCFKIWFLSTGNYIAHSGIPTQLTSMIYYLILKPSFSCKQPTTNGNLSSHFTKYKLTSYAFCLSWQILLEHFLRSERKSSSRAS